MSLSCRYAAQCCARQLRAAPIRAASSSLLQQQQRMTRRYNSTDAAVSPKISTIVDQISQLTLLETADLVASLKVRTTAWPGPASVLVPPSHHQAGIKLSIY